MEKGQLSHEEFEDTCIHAEMFAVFQGWMKAQFYCKVCYLLVLEGCTGWHPDEFDDFH